MGDFVVAVVASGEGVAMVENSMKQHLSYQPNGRVETVENKNNQLRDRIKEASAPKTEGPTVLIVKDAPGVGAVLDSLGVTIDTNRVDITAEVQGGIVDLKAVLFKQPRARTAALLAEAEVTLEKSPIVNTKPGHHAGRHGVLAEPEPRGGKGVRGGGK